MGRDGDWEEWAWTGRWGIGLSFMGSDQTRAKGSRAIGLVRGSTRSMVCRPLWLPHCRLSRQRDRGIPTDTGVLLGTANRGRANQRIGVKGTSLLGALIHT